MTDQDETVTASDPWTELEKVLNHRHQSVRDICQYFTYAHLPEGPLQGRSMSVCSLALAMVSDLPDSPELTTGLRKLLEAKDCFVRAAL